MGLRRCRHRKILPRRGRDEVFLSRGHFFAERPRELLPQIRDIDTRRRRHCRVCNLRNQIKQIKTKTNLSVFVIVKFGHRQRRYYAFKRQATTLRMCKLDSRECGNVLVYQACRPCASSSRFSPNPPTSTSVQLTQVNFTQRRTLDPQPPRTT